MKDYTIELINILKEEVKPAVGCTEPVALALACAKARELLNDVIIENNILVSPNVYKNGMCVGIPGTDRLGMKIAASIGIIAGNSKQGLNLLDFIDKNQIEEAERYMDNNLINISPINTEEKVYIEVFLRSKKHNSKVIIREKHDKFVYLEVDENILLNYNPAEAIKNKTIEKQNIISNLTVKEIINTVENMKFEDIEFLLDGIEMNENIANYGISQKVGAGVGYGIKKSIEEGILSDDLITRAMMITAGASDARMSGIKMPVMSSNGSGNHGLTAILPIVAYNKKFPQSDENLSKALAISHLITAFIKNYTGRLSAICGCGVAAATGSTAAIAWLMNLDIFQIEGAIENMVANLSGMICDGAKPGCALKLSSAAAASIQSAILEKYQCRVPELNGIVGKNVEESIKNLGILSNQGMCVTDDVIINVMNVMNE